MKKERTEYLRQYQKEYYWKNRDRIRAQYQQQSREIEQHREAAKNRTEIQFYKEWNKQLTERLKSNELEDWLRTSIKRIVEENNRQIDTLNEKRLLKEKDRRTGIPD